MKKIIRLTENDLARIVRRVIQENEGDGCEHLTGRMAMAFNKSKKYIESIKDIESRVGKYGEPEIFHELREELNDILDVAIDKNCSNIEELIQTKNNFLYFMARKTGELDAFMK